MPLTSLLCLLLLLLSLVVDGTAPPLNLTILPQAFADLHGAKCLDGSPPAMFTRVLSSSAPLILFLEGGGWCTTIEDCASRASGGGGSSKDMARTMTVGGLLSTDPAINPRFASTASFAFLHYCDGASMTSNASQPDSAGSWHRGRPNLLALLAYLRTVLGVSTPTQVILSGGSAGALAAFAALDVVCGLFPGSACVGAPDAGFFLDAGRVDDPTNHAFRAGFISADSTMWQSTAPTGGLPAACVAAFPGEAWRCFFAQNNVLYTRAPVHATMAAYDLYSFPNIYGLPCIPPACSGAQLQLLQGWRLQQLGTMAAALNGFPGNGAYVDSCIVHEQNVDYCSGQSLPNCKGWLVYNISVPGFPPQLTPQAGLYLWLDSISARWPQVQAARAEWAARVDAATASGLPYPSRTPDAAAAAAMTVQLFDPLPWPQNPSCQYGVNATQAGEADIASLWP